MSDTNHTRNRFQGLKNAIHQHPSLNSVKCIIISIVVLWVILVSLGATSYVIYKNKYGDSSKNKYENNPALAIHYTRTPDYKEACYVAQQIPQSSVKIYSAIDGSDNAEGGGGAAGSPYYHYHPSKDSNTSINLEMIKSIEHQLFAKDSHHPQYDPNGFNALFPSWMLFLGSMMSNPVKTSGKNNPDKSSSDRWINSMTSFIDASSIYSADPESLHKIRTNRCGMIKMNQYKDGGGLMTDPRYHKFVTFSELTTLYAGVTAIHNLFIREHNRIASKMCQENSNYKDEYIFRTARRIVIMEIQIITYNELLPGAFGKEIIEQPCYRHTTKPFVSAEWALAALPSFLSMIPEHLELRDSWSGKKTGEYCYVDELLDQHPDNNIFSKISTSDLIFSLMKQPAEALDLQVAGDLPEDDISDFNKSCKKPKGLRRKLACYVLKLQMHPDKSDFVGLRWMFHISSVTNWTDINNNPVTQEKLSEIYGEDGVYEMDLLPGLMAESDFSNDRTMGHTLALMMADQLSRVRNSDIFFVYWNMPPELDGEGILSTRLRDILIRNTDISPRFLPPLLSAFTTKNLKRPSYKRNSENGIMYSEDEQDSDY